MHGAVGVLAKKVTNAVLPDSCVSTIIYCAYPIIIIIFIFLNIKYTMGWLFLFPITNATSQDPTSLGNIQFQSIKIHF